VLLLIRKGNLGARGWPRHALHHAFFRWREIFTTRGVLKSPPAHRCASTAPPTELPALPVAIATARAADLPIVARLAHEIWHRHYPGIIPVAQIDYMLARSYNLEALADYLTRPDAGLALAMRDEAPVGFVGWFRLEPPASMKLDKLYVVPEHHGAGIGRALIEHVVMQARAAACSRITLNVNRGNAGSIRAYERCGFVISERGDFPIGNGYVMEDFIMVRQL
jgi:diamine N-acetyltransferase